MSQEDRGFWTKPKSRWSFGIPAGGFVMLVVGALAWVTFDWSLHATSTDEFCTACHNSPSNWVMEEWQQSKHFASSSGVKVNCHDCHIPKSFVDKIWVKGTSAVHHVTTQIVGDYQTKEDFEAKRLMLAERVWDTMQNNDSQACRSCHKVELMDFAQQSETAAQYHEVLLDQDGPTCIDCHKGIAHHMP